MKTTKRLEAGLTELGNLDPRMAELWRQAGTPGPPARLLDAVAGDRRSAIIDPCGGGNLETDGSCRCCQGPARLCGDG